MSTSAMDDRVELTTAVIAQLDELRPTTVNSSEKLSLIRVYFALKQEKLRNELSATKRIRYYTATLFGRYSATISRLVTARNKLYRRSSDNADSLKSEFYTSKCSGNYQSISTRIPLNTHVLSEVRKFVETKRLNREK